MAGPGKPVPLDSALFYATHSTFVTNVIIVNAIFYPPQQRCVQS